MRFCWSATEVEVGEEGRDFWTFFKIPPLVSNMVGQILVPSYICIILIPSFLLCTCT